ncbi:mitochondrial carrier protein MTM1 [Ziziphus jujuba]|uniref:Mitochondrial carrier protein MTM1 n=1 Tax=Ziziphus jujuba TaxID=326968 RepID=A0A6P4ATI5_ZIZJJ|nr:mitochondrial carrier protein MTM1 [Ziziphus jujuba]
MVWSRHSIPSWLSAAATRVDFEANPSKMLKDGNDGCSLEQHQHRSKPPLSDANLGFGGRVLSAAGAAVLSAILVNPLDVAKTRLQAQAAGVPYQGLCYPACSEANTILPNLQSSASSVRSNLGLEPVCRPECSQYKGTVDVFYKVIRQEGFLRLWRGTNASLALAVPTVGIYLPCYDIFRNLMEDFTTQNAPNLTPYVPLVAGSVARSLACLTCYPIELARTRMQAFIETQIGVKPPGVFKTLLGVVDPAKSTNFLQNLQSYRILWTGLGAQLARDVPFSAICWSTLEPIRRRFLDMVGDKASLPIIFGANFSAGFAAGTLAAAFTCPLDVARTRRQIEKDPSRAVKMTTRSTLVEIWRDGGMKGLFTGIGPRVGRAGPSVGIVVSFYEVVKYALHHHTHLNQ